MGINFYGNKLVLDTKGRGRATATVDWNQLQGSIKYSHCLNIARPEAMTLAGALPFDPSAFEGKFDDLAMKLTDLRMSHGLSLLSPGFTALGEGLPAPGMLLTGATDFFRGIRTQICGELGKNEFNVNSELGLGDGDFFGFTGPLSDLQDKFDERCMGM